eukprot:13350812-Alexandrium_andersonii.AAC.1
MPGSGGQSEHRRDVLHGQVRRRPLSARRERVAWAVKGFGERDRRRLARMLRSTEMFRSTPETAPATRTQCDNDENNDTNNDTVLDIAGRQSDLNLELQTDWEGGQR